MSVAAILRWVSYLTDPEKEQYFHSNDPENYVLLCEHIDNLVGSVRRAAEQGVALPSALSELIELLLDIERETDEIGYERWCAYCETDPKWRRAIELAREAEGGLQPRD